MKAAADTSQPAPAPTPAPTSTPALAPHALPAGEPASCVGTAASRTEGGGSAPRQQVPRPRRVVITGGSRGIGLAYVDAFAGAGHRVLFTYNSTDEQTVADVIARYSRSNEVKACRLDQGNLISVERFAASVEDWLGGDPLDTLINNAGLGSKTVEGYAGLNRAMVGESDVSAKAGHSKEAAWRLKAAQDEALMRVNGLGPLWVTEALLPFLLPSHPGDGEGQGEGQGVGHLSRRPVVIFTGSVGGSSQSTFPGFRAADGMSKAAITYAVKMLAAEHVHSNITITCVCPGATLTSMFKSSTLDRMADPDKFVAALPQGRCIRPSELASTALWLATDPASRLFHGAILDASQGLAVRPGVLTEYQP